MLHIWIIRAPGVLLTGETGQVTWFQWNDIYLELDALLLGLLVCGAEEQCCKLLRVQRNQPASLEEGGGRGGVTVD